LNLEGVWGETPRNVYAVGANVIFNYDGADWTPVRLALADLFAIHGSGNNVYVVGDDGHFMVSDGQTWSAGQTAGMTHDLVGVAVSSPYAAIAVGGLGGVVLLRGASSEIVNRSTGGTWNDVAGLSVTSAYIVGSSKRARQYVGGEWNEFGLFDGWAVGWLGTGQDGYVYRFDGGDWTPSATLDFIPRDVSGAGDNDIYIVGDGGHITHFGGTGWESRPSPTARDLFAVWCSAGGEAYAAGEDYTLLRYVGGAWSSVILPSPGWSPILSGVSGCPRGDVVAVGQDGFVLRNSGSVWDIDLSGTSEWLRAVWGARFDNFWAVGDGGAVVRFDGVSWRPQQTGLSVDFNSVWGSGGNDVFLCGDNDYVLHYEK
jgi:hypothetical protein